MLFCGKIGFVPRKVVSNQGIHVGNGGLVIESLTTGNAPATIASNTSIIASVAGELLVVRLMACMARIVVC